MTQVNEVFVVTHGEKKSDPNPGMTARGFAQTEKLGKFLPKLPSKVICGTGRRHCDVAEALELKPSRFSPLAGSAESGEKDYYGRIIVLLSHGQQVPFAEYTGLEDLAPTAQTFVLSLPHNAVLCSGRELVTMLGVKALSGTVYKISHDSEKILAIKEITST